MKTFSAGLFASLVAIVLLCCSNILKFGPDSVNGLRLVRSSLHQCFYCQLVTEASSAGYVIHMTCERDAYDASSGARLVFL